MDFYFDREGNPISLDEWMSRTTKKGGQLSEQIARTERGDVTVSTIYTGLNLTPLADRPGIFETMIFGGDEDGYRRNYATEAEAVAGHEVACRLAFGEMWEKAAEGS